MKRIIRNLVAGAALAAALLASTVAEAATLYITEWPNTVSQIGSVPATDTPPAPPVTTQTVVVGAGSLQSAAFNTKTRVVGVICDVGCSVAFGSSPLATTSTTLLQQGVTYYYGVAAGTKIAVIANTAGNTGGGGGGGGGAVTIADGADVTQGAIADAAATAGGTGTLSAKIRRLSLQLPAGLGQTTMAASMSVAIASNQSAIPVTSTQLPPALDSNSNLKTVLYDSAGNPLSYNPNGAAVPSSSSPVVSASPTTIATGQVAPTSSAATLLASRALRFSVTFENTGAVDVWIGPATVTTSNGLKLPPGATYTSNSTALFQAITASATGAISYVEEY